MKELIAPLGYFPELKHIKNEIPEDENVRGGGFCFWGEDNAMYGLRGSEHPASQWERTEQYCDNVRDAVLTKQWKDNDSRRESHSKKMTETWENNYEHMAEQARKNGRHGMKGKDIHNTLDIEYKGVVYYGWSELKEKTGVSKHLYKKYYEKGIDPEPRIGKDGPVRGTKYK